MLKPKVVKLILDELEIKPLTPFYIAGESCPYRIKKDGGMERYIGKTWGETSYTYIDLIMLVDNHRVSVLEKEIADDLK